MSIRHTKHVDSIDDDDDETHSSHSRIPLTHDPSIFQRLLNWLITNPSEPVEHDILPKHKKNYQYWNSSKEFFILGGRFKINKNKPISILVFLSILIPFILFCIFESSFCWNEIHPASVIMFVYCWLICLSSFIKASSYDAGYTAKNIHFVSTNIPEEYYNLITLPTVNNKKVDIRYCHTCNNWRLPRTFHCSKCDGCISIHDHHCIWINNCVGERNYRFFFNFLLFAVISTIYYSIFSYYHLFHYQHSNKLNFIKALKHLPMSLVNAILGHILTLYPMALIIYHSYFLMTQQTTREYLKTSNDKNYQNPFTLDNYFKNFIVGLFKPRGYSLVQRRQIYEIGDQRFHRFSKNNITS